MRLVPDTNTALAAEAEIIVSGDSDLLVLKEHRGIPILKAANVINRLSE